MTILGISGSPNPDGNTSFAVRHALDRLEAAGFETEYVSLSGKHIEPCIGCWSCSGTGRCVHDDDMASIHEAIRRCDGLVLASPVYFGLVSGQLKTMMDRCVVFRPSYEREPELSGRTGCGIACGGFRNGGQETTLQNIHTFLLQQNMKVVNDGRGFSHAGGTIVGTAREDELGLLTVRNLADNLAKALGR